jgi:hypothetical protein
MSQFAYPESRHPALMDGRVFAYHASILNRKENVWLLKQPPHWDLHEATV